MNLTVTGAHEGVQIHETAIVDPAARLGRDVRVGPFAIVGPDVTVGVGTRIGPRVLIERDTVVGSGCRIGNGAVLGTPPQDLKYTGAKTFLRIGDRTIIREFATLNRASTPQGTTLVGSDCLLMSYSHVAHDCRLGDHVVISNATAMAGHVEIGDWAFISGLVTIHQFVRIGAHSFVGGGSRISQDVPPYCTAVGNPTAKLFGLNSVGLRRRGIPSDVRRRLKGAYRILFQSSLPRAEAIERVKANSGAPCAQVACLVDFICGSQRGVTS